MILSNKNFSRDDVNININGLQQLSVKWNILVKIVIVKIWEDDK